MNQQNEQVKKPVPASVKRKAVNRNRALARAALQVLFFVTMPGAFVAGFNGIKYVFRQMGTGSVLELNSFAMVLIGLGGFTILFGRFFCGYVCSFGALGDLIYWISGLFQKKVLKKRKQLSLPKQILPVLQKLKYLNLAFIVLMTAAGLMDSLHGTSPWDVFSRFTALKLPTADYLPGIICLILILAGMALQSRFFCQFLCPLGAFFAVLPILPPAMLHRDAPNCLKGCSACRNTCPVGLKLEKDGLRNGECISCGKCTGVCPKYNLHYPAEALFKNEILYTLFRAAVFFILGIWLGLCRIV
jgi:polyferredoxin